MFADVVNALVDAEEAYYVSTKGDLKDTILSSVYSEILSRMSKKLYYAEWYSRPYLPKEFDEYKNIYPAVKEIADILTDRGYTCTVTQSTPTLERGIYCTRLYVTWDNKSSGNDI